MDFTKKFNIGLTLDTNIREFKAFLEEYHPYIHSVFFSPPFGAKFHTRTKVANQFLLVNKRATFWQMLELIKQYGIELELLLNTLCLDEKLIAKAADGLKKRGVEVDSVCFLEPYYPAVLKHFPDKKYIWSFNNGLRRESDVLNVIDNFRVDALVLGSSFIRNNSLFAKIASRGKQTYLLLNNGCSFNCATCNNTNSTCNQTFYDNLKKFSVDYLYALQSIFPNELHEGVIDGTNITCYKISNRSSNLAFIKGALDSYLNCEVRKYVAKSRLNYAFWGRAGYFWKYFGKLDLEKIIAYKQQILHREFIIK